ncbi:helix-turn-helix domain-containing protein [Spiribacter aquaticus]|uniref:Helix-turn-helix domain-containing protein n=1 Tax=Spiribacter aquaticus TaxID=1935996 RepID=A0A557RGP0_9GAMM|nr:MULTISPECIES: helix-turn-helix domain-containing protein [Spiribacter]TVO64312.1 helix-turn-helix domain-containing protein [Spiribacter aquaticus]
MLSLRTWQPNEGDPVDSHYNAALTPRGRARMVRAVIDQGLSYRKAAERFHVDPKTVQRWTQRYGPVEIFVCEPLH